MPKILKKQLSQEKEKFADTKPGRGLAAYRKLAKSKKTTPITSSTRAGLLFGIPRVHNLMKKHRLARSVGKRPSVVMAAAMEYVSAEVLELAGNIVMGLNKKRITPRTIMLAISGDDELFKLVGCKATFTESGVAPHIEPAMLAKKGGKTAKKVEASDADTANLGTQEV